jgi:hypothetical protein
MSDVEELLGANRADIAGAAGDKNVHAGSIKKFRAGESSKIKEAAARLATQRRPKQKQQCLPPDLAAGVTEAGNQTKIKPGKLSLFAPAGRQQSHSAQDRQGHCGRFRDW